MTLLGPSIHLLVKLPYVVLMIALDDDGQGRHSETNWNN